MNKIIFNNEESKNTFINTIGNFSKNIFIPNNSLEGEINIDSKKDIDFLFVQVLKCKFKNPVISSIFKEENQNSNKTNINLLIGQDIKRGFYDISDNGTVSNLKNIYDYYEIDVNKDDVKFKLQPKNENEIFIEI